MIEVKSLTKRFGPTVAVDRISFDVAQGEILGFLGPNGAGKTTTVRILTCYLSPDEGTASVAGFDTFTQSIEVRKRVGYLPESAPLYNDMGVVDCLRFVAEVRGIPRSEQSTRIRKMIDVCGLGSVLHKEIGQLSRGFRQRVGLALTLIHDPEVLILDEPTSGLDPNQIIEIRDLIKEIGREKTTILCTHILPEVEATCSRVQIINEGRIVADGTPQELGERAEGEARTVLTIRASADSVEPVLRAHPMVKSLQLLAQNPTEVRYAVGTKDGGDHDTEAELFRLAVNEGWVLTELQRETVSLEKVFLKLTTRERG